MDNLKVGLHGLLRKSERIFKTDMVYLVKSGFWLNLNLIIVTLFSFILSILFARYLSKEEYGTYQFILSIASIIGALTLTGMNTAITQAVARGFEGTLKRSVIVQLVWGVIPFFASLGVSLYYLLNGNNSLSVAFVVVAIFLPFLNAFNTYGSFFIGKKNFKGAMLFAQITNVLYYGMMFAVMYFFKSNALLLISINFGVNAIATLICYILTIRIYKPNEKEEAHTISYGKHLSLMNILTTISNQIDSIVVFHFLGAAQLAIYAFASIIPDRLGGVIRSVVLMAFPKLSIQNNTDKKKYIIKKILTLFWASSLLFILYILIAPLLFKIFFPKYISSILFSQAYTLIVILSMASGLVATYLQSSKALKQLYILSTSSALIQISLLFIFCIFYGMWGVILAKIISSIISILLGILLFFNIHEKN